VPNRINRRDLLWVLIIIVSFAFALAVSWERWGNPLVDCGREMNQPLRLARGESLYLDVRHIYGPLSPHINALLFELFGPSLGVLYADGIVSALLILALVYWLARQLMGRAPATAAALSVMWLCAFKQAGNYILPYSYSALHGCALGLVSLALMVKAAGSGVRGRGSEVRAGLISDLKSPGAKHNIGHEISNHSALTPAFWLAAAGVAAGLTTLAKTEMGLAALTAGVAAASLIGYPNLRRALALVASFVVPAVIIVVAVYGLIVSQVGWSTMAEDSFLFLGNLSPELVYFNKRVSGFDQPLMSLMQMAGAAARVSALAAAIAAISLLLTRRKRAGVALRDLTTDSGRAAPSQLWLLAGLALIAILSFPLADGMSWDKGPYLAMPLLLAGLLTSALVVYQKQHSKRGEVNRKVVVLLVVAVYALASLARVILRVRSGGAYSSYLLPASVILFTYAWAYPFAGLFRHGRTRRLARNIAIGLIMFDVVVTASMMAYRYRSRNTYPINSARGTIVAVPDLGQAFKEAIAYVNRETAPGEPVVVMPEGTSLNFFTDRPNPLREEITTPGFLDDAGQERAIRQITESGARFVMIANRATPEFGASVFGRDYCVQLMRWVEDNYEMTAVFGPDKNPALEIGDRSFFIRAYRKKNVTATPPGPEF
jgi:hypothetical protein